jgi:type IV pilus assembly protein PilA
LICPKCGTTLAENSRFCFNCGYSASQVQPGGQSVPPPAGSALPASYNAAPPFAPAQTSGKAIASLVCGIINVFPLFIVAIVLGHISLSEIKKSGGRIKGEGLAIAGLVMGYLGILAIPLILIIAAIAIPNLLRAKIAANEASAVGSVRYIVAAEVNYQSTHADAGFTCNLSDLSGQLDSQLTSWFKHGYVFFLQNCNAEKDGGPVSKFQITAIPKMPNNSGKRAFCSDESGVLRSNPGGSAETCLSQGTPLE